MPTVIVYWSPGRSDTQKNAVARGITQALVDEGGAKIKDVLIIFQNILPGDAMRGPQFNLEDQELHEDHADKRDNTDQTITDSINGHAEASD